LNEKDKWIGFITCGSNFQNVICVLVNPRSAPPKEGILIFKLKDKISWTNILIILKKYLPASFEREIETK